MSPDWNIDSSISTVGFVAERTERSLRDECTSRKKMDGNVRLHSKPF
jgi:hypothetical protein